MKPALVISHCGLQLSFFFLKDLRAEEEEEFSFQQKFFFLLECVERLLHSDRHLNSNLNKKNCEKNFN